MNFSLALGAGFFCASLGLTAMASTKETSPRPDIFLITIDTLRADHVHCYGYERVKTPALDALARDGIRFQQAFTASPITNSSHASILTGLLPSSHGVTDFGVPLSPTNPTLAELLRQQRYHTAAFIGAVILDSKTLAPGFDQGFDFYDNFPEHPTSKSRWGRIERRGMEVVRHAKTWLSQHPTGPHFLWVHLYDPHDPYTPPEPYSRIYKDHLYDGEIAYADSALANFIAYLKKTGRYRNSIIVVVGDHGEGLGEHHEDTHGIFLYDSTTHVPLILKRAHGLNAGVAVDAQVTTLDIAPTILDLAHAPAFKKTDGSSLRPYFAGAEKAEHIAFGETDYPLRFGWAPLRSVRSQGYKYIEAPRPEFYDLQNDTGELINRYEPWNERVQRERAMLTEVRAREPASATVEGAVGQETIEELKALGYVGPADAGSATTASEPSMLPDPKDKIEEQNLLHAAMMAAEDDRNEEARKLFQNALALDPGSSIALRQLGELELRAEEYDNAAEHLKGATQARPNDATAFFYQGQALVHLHDFARARDALEASMKLVPDQLPGRLLLGRVYLGLNQPKEAEDQFEAALLLQSNGAEAQQGLAEGEIEEGNFTVAVRQLEALSRTDAKNPDLFEWLAKGYAGLGEAAKAQHARTQAQLLRQQSAHPSDK